MKLLENRLTIVVLLAWVFDLTPLSSAHAQKTEESTCQRTGKMTLAWGYNRAFFSKSDIHLSGDGYDFVLRKVKAKDFPSPFKPDVYFGPTSLTIPQFNARAGYFITDKISLSFGYDHMKYVVEQYQDVLIDGYISHKRNIDYPGIYENSTITIQPDFLRYEHTDGLNYFSLEADYFHTLWKHPSGKHTLSCYGGGGGGFILPRSDVSIFDETAANIFHVAGFGASVNAGVRFDFYKHFFFQMAGKSGFISLPDVITHYSKGEKAAQRFGFVETFFQLGGSWRIHSCKKGLIKKHGCSCGTAML